MTSAMTGGLSPIHASGRQWLAVASVASVPLPLVTSEFLPVGAFDQGRNGPPMLPKAQPA